MYVSCMSHVCLMYVSCICFIYVLCVSYVCLMYVSCMSCMLCARPTHPSLCLMFQENMSRFTNNSKLMLVLCMYVCMHVLCMCPMYRSHAYIYIYTYISAYPILRHTIRHQLQFTHMPWASHIHNRPIVFTFSLGQPTHTKRTHIQNAPSS